MNPLLLCDYYKTEHFRMYPENMTKLYSNFTPLYFFFTTADNSLVVELSLVNIFLFSIVQIFKRLCHWVFWQMI